MPTAKSVVQSSSDMFAPGIFFTIGRSTLGKFGGFGSFGVSSTVNLRHGVCKNFYEINQIDCHTLA